MIIYIDNDFKCHAENAGGLRAFEVPFFDGKCRRLIEGFRYIPQGETWESEQGAAFRGEMRTPFADYAILAAAQEQYEQLQAELLDMQTALHTLGVEADG